MSVDSNIGLPFNIASYALLVHILCHVCNYKPGKLIMTLGDTHIYKEHVNQCLEQIKRIPYRFPTLEITKPFENNMAIEFIEKLDICDFKLNNYRSHSAIKANMIA